MVFFCLFLGMGLQHSAALGEFFGLGASAERNGSA